MPIQILMPALSPSMEHGKLAKWHVCEGEKVCEGDVIAEVVTDKATIEVEAIDDGIIETILVPAGTERVRVNTPIAILLDEGLSGAHTEAEGYSRADIGSVAAVALEAISAPKARRKPKHKHDDETTLETIEGECTSMTLRDALRAGISEEMRKDDDVFVIGEEVAQFHGAAKVTKGLVEEFGARRVVDTPITEAGFVGLAVGAAYGGLKPVVEFMRWDFVLQALDQIINSAAKVRYLSGGQFGVPIVFRGPNGASSQLGAQHSQCLASLFAHVPGLKVVAPTDAADAKGLIKSAIRDPDPVIVLENEDLYGQRSDVPVSTDWCIPIGKARVVRKGGVLTICSYGRGLHMVKRASDELAATGIEAEVIDLRSLRPLDIDCVAGSVRRTQRLLMVEESWPACSVGGEVCLRVSESAFDYLAASPVRLSGADAPMPYSMSLEMAALPSIRGIVNAASALVESRD